MKIVSKKTGEYQEVSKDQWEWLRANNLHRKYDVIDASDDHLVSEEIEVESFPMAEDDNDDMAEVRWENPTIADFNDEDDEKDYYRKKLDEAGVSYHPNTGLEKLKQKYEAL